MRMSAIGRLSAHDLQECALARAVLYRSLTPPDGVLVCWKRLWNTPGPMNISSSALTTAQGRGERVVQHTVQCTVAAADQFGREPAHDGDREACREQQDQPPEQTHALVHVSPLSP